MQETLIIVNDFNLCHPMSYLEYTIKEGPTLIGIMMLISIGITANWYGALPMYAPEIN